MVVQAILLDVLIALGAEFGDDEVADWDGEVGVLVSWLSQIELFRPISFVY